MDRPNPTARVSPVKGHRGPPAQLQAIVAGRSIAQVKAIIIQRYGFTPTDEYCRDLIAFVEAMTNE